MSFLKKILCSLPLLFLLLHVSHEITYEDLAKMEREANASYYEYRQLIKADRLKRRMTPNSVDPIDVSDDPLSSITANFVFRGNAWSGTLSELWVLRLFVNIFAYCTVLIPGYLFIRFVKRSSFLQSHLVLQHKSTFFGWFVRLLVYGEEHPGQKTILPVNQNDINGNTPQSSSEAGSKVLFSTKSTSNEKNELLVQVGYLTFYFLGLQFMYLTWGLLQERIMTHEYGETGQGEHFADSQFLVFLNRISAFVLASFWLILSRHSQPPFRPPLYIYCYSSLSNIMSSWCQYEALKFISFPVQILAKTSKIIPVMLMGRIISRKTYTLFEYLVAAAISCGVAIFLLSGSGRIGGKLPSSSRHSSSSHGENSIPSRLNTVTVFSGVILLIGYIAFDSFTSNWQSKIFQKYKASTAQMMCATNFFSSLLTCVSLWEQGGFWSSVHFMIRYPRFFFHASLLSFCSAGGQIFIFYTIRDFGAVIFMTMMTIRQALAILLSCIVYFHPVNFMGFCGLLIVFVAIFSKIYFLHFARKRSNENLTMKRPPLSPIVPMSLSSSRMPSQERYAVNGDLNISNTMTDQKMTIMTQ